VKDKKDPPVQKLPQVPSKNPKKEEPEIKIKDNPKKEPEKKKSTCSKTSSSTIKKL